jgi:hypothetical protein
VWPEAGGAIITIVSYKKEGRLPPRTMCSLHIISREIFFSQNAFFPKMNFEFGLKLFYYVKTFFPLRTHCRTREAKSVDQHHGSLQTRVWIFASKQIQAGRPPGTQSCTTRLSRRGRLRSVGKPWANLPPWCSLASLWSEGEQTHQVHEQVYHTLTNVSQRQSPEEMSAESTWVGILPSRFSLGKSWVWFFDLGLE